MGFLNLNGSIKYGPHGKRRKTNAFTKCKKIPYNTLLEEQQKQYNRLVLETAERIPSLDSGIVGNITPRKDPMQYTGERKLLGIAVMHKSNLVPVFAEDKDYAKDLARMRR